MQGPKIARGDVSDGSQGFGGKRNFRQCPESVVFLHEWSIRWTTPPGGELPWNRRCRRRFLNAKAHCHSSFLWEGFKVLARRMAEWGRMCYP